jgi:diphthamide biosynthesis enzyme Dph1/Dph2-like protein
MKILYIEARQKLGKDDQYFIDPNFIKTLPRDVYIVYSVQFKGQALAMKEAIAKHGNTIRGFNQVLGCSKLKTPYTILLIGQGRFHATNLALQNPEHPILIYSNGSSIAFGEKDIEKLRQNQKNALNLFFASDKIGILVSTKPGQEHLDSALSLKKKIEKKHPEKKVFLFVSNNINTAEFVNFDVPIFINTACKGMAYDSPKIANIDDILDFL